MDLFKKHTHIGLDLDETLAASVMDGLSKFHERGKMRFIREFDEIRYFNWTDFIEADVTQEEFEQFWREHNLTDVLPVPGAIDGVYQLYTQGKFLSVITARNEHDHASDCRRWLNMYFPQIHPSMIYFANHFARHSNNKSDLCREHGISLMIEDGMHNAEDLVTHGITCILLEKPWNREVAFEHPLLYRAKDWNEIITAINA